MVVVFGVPVAIANLRLIRKQQDQAGLMRFMDEFEASAIHRQKLFREFPVQDDYAGVDPDLLLTARKVMDMLNRIALLMERRMVAPFDVLSMTHATVIRCWFKLEQFAAYQERTSGGRYGRRVAALAARAKRFHDIRPHQRTHVLKVHNPDGSSVVAYATTRRRWLAGGLQNLGWAACYIFRWY